MTKDVTFSRRRLLQGGAVVAGLATAPALGKGPMLVGQAPYFYRFKLGNAEATIVSDSITAAAAWPTTARATSRTRSTTSRRPTTITGLTRKKSVPIS